MTKYVLRISIAVVSIAVVVFFIFSQERFFRIDLSKEKRFSVAQSSKSILEGTNGEIGVTLYLSGDLDANMTQLRYAVRNKMHDLNVYAKNNITMVEWDPNDAESDEERYANYKSLERLGMKGMSVASKNDKGGISQSVVFPWLSVSYNNDTIPVCLINPDNNLSPHLDAVNSAIEEMEYLIMDAIRVLTNKEVVKIAFIEGHGELSEMETYNISESLSRYFQVDRGVINGQVGVLDDYEAIIIANPTESFSEQDKYVIDQYIMKGGAVLWSVDGVKMSDSLLSHSGFSPVIPIDLNLNDMFFKYGVRISSTIVQDMQCAYSPVNIAMPNEAPKFENIPWFYSPLLNTSPYHQITRNRGEVMANFVSALEFTGDTSMVSKEILLISGNASRVSMAPADIDVNRMMNIDPKKYFIHGFVPIAAVLSGKFKSLYENRMLPVGIVSGERTIARSNKSKMIVVADGSIMRNSIESQDGGLWVVPLGYDRVSQRTYGNTDFVINSLLYLTDNDGFMGLRNRTIPVRLLNSALVQENSLMIKIVNVVLPICLLICAGLVSMFIRRRKYN